MTSRQRLLTSLSHRQPDRVPIDLGGHQTGIHRKAYKALLDFLDMTEDVRIVDAAQQLAAPSERLLQRFHVDTRYVRARPAAGFKDTVSRVCHGDRTWYELPDEFGVIRSMPEEPRLFMAISHNPLAEATVGDLAEYPFPHGGDPTRFRGVRAEALEIQKASAAALCTATGGVVYETCWYMRGRERWYMDMLENVSFCEALLDRVLKYRVDFYRGFMGEVGDLVDVVMIGDDLAGQGGPLFSPDFYRRIVKPRQKLLVQHIKTLTPAKIWYHTCGACSEIIPELIDNGIDILNPVQISAEGMDPHVLKTQFGDRVSFWGGGIDAQHILPLATPEAVRAEVKRNVNAFKPGGGYVFNNVNNIQHDVPPQNIVALFDAAFEYGSYNEETE